MHPLAPALLLLVLLLMPACPVATGVRRGRGGRGGRRQCGCGGCGGGIPSPPPPPPSQPSADCSFCSAGQYLAQSCTAYADRVCASCSATQPATCGVGSYRQDCGASGSQGSCQTCGSCEEGEYRSGCSGLSAGTCASCALDCAAGQYLTGCEGSSRGSCTACPGGTYVSGSGYRTSCTKCATCAAGKSVATACTGDADTTCRDNSCTACDPGKYLLGCDTLTGNVGTCEPCTTCGVNQYVSGCGIGSAGTCQNCPANMGSPVGSTALTDCQCVSGYDNTTNGADCQQCLPGKYKDSSISVCTQCEPGKFTTASGALSCSPCSEECMLVQVETLACGSSHDRICQACATCEQGTFLVGCSGLLPGTCVREGGCVPLFGARRSTVTVAQGGVLGTSHLATPRDLQFHPLKPDELWVASASPDNRLSGTFIIKNPGTPQQSTSLLRDRVAYHYMDNIAALEFSADGRVLFTCQESVNPYMHLAPANFFQGPTAFEVYPCNGGYGRAPKSFCSGETDASNCAVHEECETFTVTHDGKPCAGDKCFLIHSDMNHEAPNCMGMAYDSSTTTSSHSNLVTPEGARIDTWNRSRTAGNVVWYMDGVRGRLMRFDLDELHGTQIIDHRKANIRRYVDVHLTRREGVPGHMVVDVNNSHLYISDTGAGRILRVKTTSGQFYRGAMCTEPQCYSHDNHFWTCGKTTELTRQKFADKTACETSDACPNSAACVRDIDNVCRPEDGGWCRYAECAMGDGMGCYTIFTEMGHLFEYELWGCTEYEVFSTRLASPSGIALSPDGRLFVADYDSGDIVAFDKEGVELGRMSTGKSGVMGLELECSSSGAANSQDDSGNGENGIGKTQDKTEDKCRLWATNVIEKTVFYLSIETPCVLNDAAALPTPSASKQACTAANEACKSDRDKTCASTLSLANTVRPDFSSHNGAGWQGRMVIKHSYGKNCTGLASASTFLESCNAAKCAARGFTADECVGTVKCRVGANGNVMQGGVARAWEDADAVQCPDRLDCSNINLDLLVMAGFFCHPCLPNPCMNSGLCTNAAPRMGFTCQCRNGYQGNSCEVSTRNSGGCGALRAGGGAYTPTAACQQARGIVVGLQCTLVCDNDNMMRVAAAGSSSGVAGGTTSRLPQSQLQLLQRTCSLNFGDNSSAWTGQDSTCACRSPFFGAHCATHITPTARINATVGVTGGTVFLRGSGEGAEGGHGVRIGAGALTENVWMQVNSFSALFLGEHLLAPHGLVAVSDVVELLPVGVTLTDQVNVYVGVDSTHNHTYTHSCKDDEGWNYGGVEQDCAYAARQVANGVWSVDYADVFCTYTNAGVSAQESCCFCGTRTSRANTSSQATHDELLGLYYWDDFLSSWAQLPGARLVETHGHRITMVGSTRHLYSRWLVLQKTANIGVDKRLWGSDKYAHCRMQYTWKDLRGMWKLEADSLHESKVDDRTRYNEYERVAQKVAEFTARSDVAQKFLEEEVGYEAMTLFTDTQFRELGVKLGHTHKLRKWAQQKMNDVPSSSSQVLSSTHTPPNSQPESKPREIVSSQPSASHTNTRTIRTSSSSSPSSTRRRIAKGFSTGGLGHLMVPDRYEVWVCVEGHECATADTQTDTQTDATQDSTASFCFVYDEKNKHFISWAPRSKIF